MAKKSILAFLLIVLIGIIYIGFYPPFFPFLKYGPFSKPISKEIFRINDFEIDPNNAKFFSEVEKVVKDKWRKDARLGFASAHFNNGTISYGMIFFSDSNMIRYKDLDAPSRLEVMYNAELETIDAKFYLTSTLPERITQYLSGNLPQLFVIVQEIHLKVKALAFKDEFIENEDLIGISCVDKLLCRPYAMNVSDDINTDKVKILGNQLYNIGSSVGRTGNYEVYLRQKFGDKTTPYWSIGIGNIINASTGEVEASQYSTEE